MSLKKLTVVFLASALSLSSAAYAATYKITERYSSNISSASFNLDFGHIHAVQNSETKK